MCRLGIHARCCHSVKSSIFNPPSGASWMGAQIKEIHELRSSHILCFYSEIDMKDRKYIYHHDHAAFSGSGPWKTDSWICRLELELGPRDDLWQFVHRAQSNYHQATYMSRHASTYCVDFGVSGVSIYISILEMSYIFCHTSAHCVSFHVSGGCFYALIQDPEASGSRLELELCCGDYS